MSDQTASHKRSRNFEMAEKAYEMVCLAGLFFKHAGRPDIAERLRIAVEGFDRPGNEVG
jgi:hypothetical protein